MLDRPIHERQSSLLEIMTGAVLLGDAGPSLGMQDPLTGGNKVRVLLPGPATLPLMAHPPRGHILSRRRSAASLPAFPDQPHANHSRTGGHGTPSGSVLDRAS